jgi:hypothetical protein
LSAYSVAGSAGSIASRNELALLMKPPSPDCARVQVEPLSMLLNTPPLVPA